MVKINEYSNLKLIFIFLVVLAILLIIKSILLRWIYINNLEIAKKISIGYEEIQEDYVETVTTVNGTLAVLADGLGNNEVGRISSMVGVKTIITAFKEEGSKERMTYFFNKAFKKANHEIIKRVEKDKGGASVLSVIINKNLLSYALVGDVMLAIFRNNELVRLSKGHSISEVAKKEYYNGKIQKQEALYALKEEKLLYYLGQESAENIEISDTPIKLYKNDIIVLMSKGVYKGLSWIEFEKILGDKNITINEKSEEIMERVKDNYKDNCNGSIMLMKYTGK
ncbi:protein phosphatase 2C domain-containing protein [Clostridium sp. C2-6-12]|uniref:PP2C family protein-serine/threonine phosphatase n=1 Tax=Clostridium sp. C2-6-12 TaxID=2698832 RepID=UPI00136EC362|nr:protein phosphatase 2C domain-containing protein [Clostridium sp. C2-6-12]